MRNQFFQRQQNIVGNRRVGIFVYRYACCRVGTIYYRITIFDAGFTHSRSNIARDINKLAVFSRAYVKIFSDDFHCAPILHLLNDFDTQKVMQAVFDCLGGQVAKQ
jgi:hypothetical protein